MFVVQSHAVSCCCQFAQPLTDADDTVFTSSAAAAAAHSHHTAMDAVQLTARRSLSLSLSLSVCDIVVTLRAS